MSTLVTDIRELRRRKPAPEPIPEQIIIPFVQPERSSPLDAVLSRLEREYPALRDLMNALDLEPVALHRPPGHTRLWDLAGQSLEGNRTYTRSEAIERIRLRTSVSQDRAEKGFQLMVEASAIESTVDIKTGKPNPHLFYLGGSTPY